MCQNLISEQYPQLSDTAFFDYDERAPLCQIQLKRIQSMGLSIQPSPHSSEELSEFDRDLELLREKVADLCNTSLGKYAIVLFPNRETALNEICEGFPWDKGSNLVIEDDFQVDSSWALQAAQAAGAKTAAINCISSRHSLLLGSYYPDRLADHTKFILRSSGVHHVLVDATPLAPFQYPDLFHSRFDFCLISLKKVCGSELCATLMRLDTADLLAPQFYGGGAVAFSCARQLWHRNFNAHSKRFENGTPSMVAIYTAYDGLNLIMNNKEQIESSSHIIEEFVSILTKKISSDRVSVKGQTVFIQVDDPIVYQQKFLQNRVVLGISNNCLKATFGFASNPNDLAIFSNAINHVF